VSTTTAQGTTERTWVAFGPVGAVGSIRKISGGFFYRLIDDDWHGLFPTLEAAKGALYAAMKPGSERPEFREH
jgi:hypothetical protein